MGKENAAETGARGDAEGKNLLYVLASLVLRPERKAHKKGIGTLELTS